MEFPEMVLFDQRFDAPKVVDVRAAVLGELERIEFADRVRPGMRVAVTAGSRGVASIVTILSTIVEELQRIGAEPFVIPAMGSHGGATGAGQRKVLRHLGVTEATVSCPIISSMDVVQIGETAEGIPVLIDKAAAGADGIVVVNRIKEHTEFHGDMGSGLMKMMVIGLGKREGALTYHSHQVQLGYRTVVTSVGRTVLQHAPILFGVATVENAYNEVAHIVAVEPEGFEEVEREFFARAKKLSAKLPFEELDILIVDEMGKEISGAGMDTNVTGRCHVVGEPPLESPRFTRIVVRDLTDASDGNATGVGFADFITRRFANKIDYYATYINCITGMSPEEAVTPIIAETDEQAIQWALITLGAIEPKEARVVRIKNTSCLRTFYASRALLPEARSRSNLKVLGPAKKMGFDDVGRLLGVYES